MREQEERLRPFLFVFPTLAAVVTYLPVLRNGFIYDDFWSVRALPPPSWHLLRQSRGLTYLFHAADRALWGTWAPGFHLTSLLLHAFATAVVTAAACALSRSRRVGLLSGLLFAVHPVHVEAVASFVNRKESLAMIFVGLAVLAWTSRKRTVPGTAAALVCFALALLSKEVAAVGLPAMLFLADLLPAGKDGPDARRRLRRALLRVLPFLAAALLAASLWLGSAASLFSPESVSAATELRVKSYSETLANVAAAVPDQLRLLFVPLRLSADYPSRLQMAPADPRAVGGWLLLASWLVLAAILARRQPLAGWAMAWTAVMYAPCSNLVPLTPFFVAERYLYVPSFGICLLLALLLDRGLVATGGKASSDLKAGLTAIAVLVIAAGALRSAIRSRDWRDEEALWRSAIAAECDTWRARLNLGNAYLAQGRKPAAAAEYRTALTRRPLTVKARKILVVNLVRAGALHSAAEECRSLVPKEPGCNLILGKAALSNGHRREALGHFRRALELLPGNVEILTETAWLLATSPEKELRDGQEAVRLAERAYRLAERTTPEILATLSAAHAEAGHVTEAQQWGWKAYGLARAEGRHDLATRIKTRIPLGESNLANDH